MLQEHELLYHFVQIGTPLLRDQKNKIFLRPFGTPREAIGPTRSKKDNKKQRLTGQVKLSKAGVRHSEREPKKARKGRDARVYPYPH